MYALQTQATYDNLQKQLFIDLAFHKSIVEYRDCCKNLLVEQKEEEAGISIETKRKKTKTTNRQKWENKHRQIYYH